MQELVIMNNEIAVTTSLKIAESFDKEHKHVLDSIKNLTAENSTVRNMFHEDEYTNSRGRKYPMFYMNRDGFSLLAMSFTGKKALEFKLAFINQFNEMEKKIKEMTSTLPSYMIENPITRAERWIIEHKEKLVLEYKIEEQQPLVEFAEKCMKSKTSVLIRELSKIINEHGVINIGERKLYKKLREWGLIVKDKTEPTQRAMNMGIFEVVQRPYNKGDYEILTHTTRVLPKGQMYIIKRLAKEIEKGKLIV